LLLRRSKAIAAGVAAGLLPPLIALSIERELRTAILEGRALARDAGHTRIEAEASSMGIVLTAALAAPIARLATDYARARLYAERYASAWRFAAQGDNPIAAANDATNARLDTLGLTEGAGAFNEARLERVRFQPKLYRMWDAVNDARTCSRCRSAHGTIVRVDDPFPDGEPGSVHPRCQCTWHILTPDEAYGATS
jgi:SPP1 gp7 family putative phage head morphogenesis protein